MFTSLNLHGVIQIEAREARSVPLHGYPNGQYHAREIVFHMDTGEKVSLTLFAKNNISQLALNGEVQEA